MAKTQWEIQREALIEDGKQFQDFVTIVFHKHGMSLVNLGSKYFQIKRGENLFGCEIKHDCQFRETQNLFLEVQEKADPANPSPVPSGLDRLDNSWLYAIGDYRTFYVFGKKMLNMMRGRWQEVPNKTKTARGLLLPVQEAEALCLWKFNSDTDEPVITKNSRYKLNLVERLSTEVGLENVAGLIDTMKKVEPPSAPEVQHEL
jgi:hypothetical protein